MSEATVEGSAPPAASEHKGFLARLMGVFFSPGETFEDVARKPTVVVPMLLLAVLTAAIFWVVAPAQATDTIAATEANARFQALSAAQQEQQLEFFRGTAYRAIVAFSSPVMVILFSMFFALLYWGAGHLFGGEPTYKGTLSMVLFVGFVNPCLHYLVKSPLILAKDTFVGVTFGPAMFMPDLAITSPTFAALALLDVFNIWSTVLIGIGIAKVGRLSTGAGLTIAVIVFLLGAGIQVGIRALTS